MFICLRYYAQDNTIKVISRPSVSLLTLFLDGHRPPKTKSSIPVNPPVLTIALLESVEGKEWP